MTGVVLDTSLWIPHLRGSIRHTEYIEHISEQQRIFMIGPVEMELRAGAGARQLPAVELVLGSLPKLRFNESSDFRRAGELAQECRSRGIGVRSQVDALITAMMERNPEVLLLHNDKDFEWLCDVTRFQQQRIELDA